MGNFRIAFESWDFKELSKVHMSKCLFALIECVKSSVEHNSYLSIGQIFYYLNWDRRQLVARLKMTSC